MTKTTYLLRSFVACVFQKNMDCPNCGALSEQVIDRKILFTTLRRCPSCRLLYRAPRDSKGQGSRFYQKKYHQGFTTEMPDEKKLQELIKREFRGGPRDYSSYLDLLDGLGIGRGSKVFEYGCSWGYGAWQMKNHGFEVQAYEISEPRCRYAREKLGIEAVIDPDQIQGLFHAVFSAHVLEHVDSVEAALSRQMQLLEPGGWLVGVTPNGSHPFRSAHPENFHRLWGLVHPQLLDDEFLSQRFKGLKLLMGSIGDEKVMAGTCACHPFDLHLGRWELVFAVQKPLEKPH